MGRAQGAPGVLINSPLAEICRTEMEQESSYQPCAGIEIQGRRQAEGASIHTADYIGRGATTLLPRADLVLCV